MNGHRRDVLQRVGATLALAVFALVLAASIPIGEAAWTETLVVSGEVATDWADPPAPAQLSIGDVLTDCNQEPSLVVAIINSGEVASGEAVVEVWIDPGTAGATLTGTAVASAIEAGATQSLEVAATPGAVHLVALFHGSADTFWSDPIDFPADTCAATAVEPITTTTATTTSTSTTTTTATTTSTSTTTTEATIGTSTSTSSSSTTTSTSSSTTSTTEPTSTTTTTTEPVSTTSTSSSTTSSTTTSSTTSTSSSTSTSTTSTTLPG